MEQKNWDDEAPKKVQRDPVIGEMPVIIATCPKCGQIIQTGSPEREGCAKDYGKLAAQGFNVVNKKMSDYWDIIETGVDFFCADTCARVIAEKETKRTDKEKRAETRRTIKNATK